MYENGYLNLGTIGTVEDPDSGIINALTDEQKKAVREYVALGIDKPIIAKIGSLGEDLSKSGYVPFGGYQFMDVRVNSYSRIVLYAPLHETADVDIGEVTYTFSTTKYIAILEFTK